MASELTELAREVGGDELVNRIDRLEGELEEVVEEIQAEMEEEDELDRLLKEEADFSDEGIDGMPLEAKREVVDELGLGEERSNTKAPVAGHPDRVPDESPDVTVNRSSPNTHEKEVPLEAGDDPETMTVEYEEAGPTMESINEYKAWLHEARSEATQEREETRQEQDEGYMPTGVVNLNEVEEVDEEDSDVPVAGQADREEDDE